jgi:phage terminase large subunit-like protein
VHDELGQVRGPRSDLYEALETAAGAQDEPLSIIISTQAPTDADLLSLLIDDAKTGADQKTKLFLYTADDSLDPFSDEAIRQANPALGDFLNAEEVRDQAESARRLPSREQAYRNLVLNQRVNMFSPFVSKNVWNQCSDEPDEEALRGVVYAGLDLSARNDLTALVLIAQSGKTWNVKCEFWAPESGLSERSRRDRAPYDLWAQRGLLQATPGATVDFGFVAQRIAELSQECELRAIGFDRWHMQYLTPSLSALDIPYTVVERIDGEVALPAGLALVRHGQGFQDMAPALDSLEAELLNKRIRHGGHPVLNWCAANAVAERNAAGSRKLEKAKSTGRIDGLVALAMAIRVALTYQQPENYVSGRLIAV